MKQVVLTAFCLAAGAGAAFAQDGADKRIEELKREFERSMKGLQEKFEQERARIEKEFKAARERMVEKRAEPGDEKNEKKKPQGVEGMLAEILKRVESLEKRLEKEAPRLRELPGMIPKNFDFDFKKRFGDGGGVPDEWRQWLEKMPRFKGGEDFKFEFRKDAPPPKKEKKDKEKEQD